MVSIQFLRMLSDLSFYAAFAAFIASAFGGGEALGGMLLCCAAYALASCVKEQGKRMLCLVPLLGCGLYRGVELLFLLPCPLYVMWLVMGKKTEVDRDRQHRMFSVFWKLMAFCLPVLLVCGNKAAWSAAIPYVVLMFAASVLLMRALRHEPEVYCRAGYQLCDFSIIALTALAARVLGSAALLRALGSALGWVYNRFILPPLVVVLRVVVWILDLLFRILSLLPWRSAKAQEKTELDLGGLALFEDLEITAGGPAWLLPLLKFILLALVAALLFFFFRWMGRGGRKERERPVHYEQRGTVSLARSPKRAESGSVKSIRRQYRRFLKSADRMGVERGNSSTSLEIGEEAEAFPELRDLAGPIRAIYVPARYGMRADKEAEEEMKRLCSEARKRSTH